MFASRSGLRNRSKTQVYNGHYQHSRYGLGYIKSSKIPSNKSSRDYRTFISNHHKSLEKSKSKLNYYRGEDCMTKFCKDLREHTTKITNYEKKDMIPLTKKEEENYKNQKVC